MMMMRMMMMIIIIIKYLDAASYQDDSSLWQLFSD